MNNYSIMYFGSLMNWDLITNFLIMHLVTWLLFLVMLTNYVRVSNIHASYSVIAERKEVLSLTIIMCFSYALMIPVEFLVSFFDIHSRYFPYTFFLFLDILTILLICFFINLESNKALLCKRYIVFCLSCNSILFLSLQIDLLLIYNDVKPFKAWWFWDVFTIGINFFDAVMILVLLIHKDILMFNKFPLKLQCFKEKAEVRGLGG